MNTLNFILSALSIGLLFSLLSVVAERLLIMMGYVRGNTIGLIIACILLAVFKQLIDFNGSLYFYILFIVVAGPIGANRVDLMFTFEKGRWWWKSENKNDVEL